ncbi:MAG TPA: putative oxidoreductase C-terminal domain-containing protein [Bryobacteraceae bacterium]
MRLIVCAAGWFALLPGALAQSKPMQLIIVDPGHFHATLLQKEMYPSLAPRVSVYATLGPEVLDYLNRISLFNSRKEDPTHWDLDVHLSADPMGEMLRDQRVRDRRGDIAVFTGRNRAKIDRILAALEAGLHVLADKPWIISPADLPKLERALALAEEKKLAAYDIMTERYEVTSQLQREFVNDADVFGKMETGSAADPAVVGRSVHHVMKTVAGVPLRRPAWFFDIAEYGEGLADVGTHVVDLVQWTAFPDQKIDFRKDIRVTAGRRWPLTLSKAQFGRVTGESEYPAALAPHVHDGRLDYYCNNSVDYWLRGVHVKLEIVWNWEAPAGSGDVYEAFFRGTKASVEIRQGAAEKFVPELYVVARGSRAETAAAVKKKVAALQTRWPGLGIEDTERGLRLTIPEKFRVGHEAHFAQVTNRFFEYVRSPGSLPAWEKDYMLAKYYVSTRGVELGGAR